MTFKDTVTTYFTCTTWGLMDNTEQQKLFNILTA